MFLLLNCSPSYFYEWVFIIFIIFKTETTKIANEFTFVNRPMWVWIMNKLPIVFLHHLLKNRWSARDFCVWERERVNGTFAMSIWIKMHFVLFSYNVLNCMAWCLQQTHKMTNMHIGWLHFSVDSGTAKLNWDKVSSDKAACLTGTDVWELPPIISSSLLIWNKGRSLSLSHQQQGSRVTA